MPRSLFALSLLLFLLSPIARGDQASLPGCEAPSTLRKIVKDQLNSPEFNRLAYDAQMERKQQVLSNLMERYPREVEPYNLWIAAAREDPGLIEPFMKEKGYIFPVVPAYSYVVNLLDGYAIPQNWVLDVKGQWDWTQTGYGYDDAWVKDMLAKLDAVKAGS